MEKSIEAKFVLRAPDNIEDDIHIVKELVTEKDKTYPNLRILKDFKRSVWITKEHYRNHKQKKESESLDRLEEIKSTQKDLVNVIKGKLGYKFSKAKSLWELSNSPYIYGIDIDSRAIIKHLYQEKYGDKVTPYTIAAFDIEVDTTTEQIILISIATVNKVSVFILEDIFTGSIDPSTAIRQLNYCYKNNIPKVDLFKDIQPEFVICKTEYDLILKAFEHIHKLKTDFVAVWNINYDVPKIVERCGKIGIDVATLFSHPDIPKEYRYFKYKEDNPLRVTESKVNKLKRPEELWHVVSTPSYSYWIDAMSAYNFIRVGGKAVPGGYSLNNILEQELGKNLKKLKFEYLDKTEGLTGLDWHRYMVKHHPVEYTIYNIWDTMSMILLDKKTTDLEVNLPVLAGISSYDVFNSGPKKIIDIIHYFYLNRKRVLGCKPKDLEESNTLPLTDWISILESIYVKDNTGRYIKESKDITTNIRKFCMDLDAVSSYPSDILAANVSKDTTHRELLDVEGIDRLDFMRQNINLFFGKVNHVEYCTTMLKFPTLEELSKRITDFLNKGE